MQSHQLWTLTTAFWLNIFTPYFGKSLKYRYILSSRSLLLFCAVEKNHFFYEHPLFSCYLFASVYNIYAYVRVYSSPLFFDPVSLLMAYQQLDHAVSSFDQVFSKPHLLLISQQGTWG